MLRMRRTLPATTGSIKQLRSLAVAFALENCEPDDQLLDDLALAVSEAATNVVKTRLPQPPRARPGRARRLPNRLPPDPADRRSRRLQQAATSTRPWPSHPQPD